MNRKSIFQVTKISCFLSVIFLVLLNSYYTPVAISNPQVTLSKMWQTGDYWKVQTYDGHTSSGKYYAVDFYYNNRNRSEIYKNIDNGLLGRPILAPMSGPIYLHLLDVSSYGSGQFPLINAVRVFQGLDPIPQTCFSMVDSLGAPVRIDMSLVVDHSSNTYRTVFSHLQIKTSYFNPSVTQKIRNAVRKFYNRTAVGSPRRVSVLTSNIASVGEQTGTIHNWGIASDYHLHFQFFNGTGYSETLPNLGYAQDLSNSSIVTIEGQKIFELAYEGSISTGVYQFPAMMRRSFNLNGAVVINTAWDGGTGANLRDNPGGNIIIFLPNGSTGSIKQITPVFAQLSSRNYLWYKVQFGTNIGWVAAEYFDGTVIGVAAVQTGVTITPNPVIIGNNFSSSFTLKETQGAQVTYEQITCAILRNDNSHCFDMQVYNNITIPANGTWNYNSTVNFNPIYQPGTYKAVARGKPIGGNWFDFGTTGGGINPVLFTAQSPSSINLISSSVPKQYKLYQNFPNPFNPVSKIKFDIPERSNVNLKLYDVLGKEILTYSTELSEGSYEYYWDGKNFPSGIYFFNLKTENYNTTIKLVLNK